MRVTDVKRGVIFDTVTFVADQSESGYSGRHHLSVNKGDVVQTKVLRGSDVQKGDTAAVHNLKPAHGANIRTCPLFGDD